MREEPLPKFSLGLLSSLMDGRKMDLSRRLKPFRGENATERYFSVCFEDLWGVGFGPEWVKLRFDLKIRNILKKI